MNFWSVYLESVYSEVSIWSEYLEKWLCRNRNFEVWKKYS